MRGKKIFINILSARGGGGTTYVKNIIPELIKAKNFTFTFIVSSKYQKELIKEISKHQVEIFDAQIPASLILRLLWEQLILPFYLKKLKCDIFYQVTESCPLLSPSPVIINVRNAILFLPWSDVKNKILFIKKLLNYPIALLSLKRADKVLCVSNSIKQYILMKYKLSHEKYMVVSHGVNSKFNYRNIKNNNSGDKYIFSVSDFMPHKNYEVLITAFNIFLKRNPDSSLKIVIAGKRNKTYFRVIQKIVSKYGLDKKVHFLGSIENENLPEYYAKAHIFVFPSKVEAFGMPLIEAMASGLPILTSRIPAFEEICNDAAIYFEHNDPNDLAKKIQLLNNNSRIRKELIEKALKRSTNFSWQKTAAGLIDIFNEV